LTLEKSRLSFGVKDYEIDSIMDGNNSENFENKEKAELILAQIHDKLAAK